MSKYSLFPFTIICFFLVSSCNIYTKESEIAKENLVSSEVQKNEKIESSQKFNCDSLDNGVTAEKINSFRIFGNIHSDSFNNVIFVTCLDDLEKEVYEKVWGRHDGKPNNYIRDIYGKILSLIFIKKMALDESPHLIINKITRFPLFWPNLEKQSIYYDRHNDKYYILAYKEDLQFLHLFELDPSDIESSKITYSFSKKVTIVDDTLINLPTPYKGFYFTGLMDMDTGVDNSGELSFFSFELHKVIPLGKVLNYALGEHNQEQVMYYIKHPQQLRTGEIKNFKSRKIELELFRYNPGKDKPELLKKIPVPTNYDSIGDMIRSPGEYVDTDLNFGLISGEAVYLGKKIIFDSNS